MNFPRRRGISSIKQLLFIFDNIIGEKGYTECQRQLFVCMVKESWRINMRDIINLNQGWRFLREDGGLPESLPLDWQEVDLPHTWNAVDGHDGRGEYYRKN